MDNLGSFFPDELNEILITNSLKVGSVLRLHVLDTTPPKIKRFIIIGISKDKISLATVYINSNLNINVFRNTKLQGLQLELNESGREYLDKDSFVDCSTIKEKSYTDLKNALQELPIKNIGTVSDTDLNQIVNKIRGAETISPVVKKRYKFDEV